MSDDRLIAACKEGKLWARKEVYEQYAPMMMSLCKRYAGNNDDAKDILQEGFLKIFTQIDQFSGTGNFGGWVRKIFVNTSLEFLRVQKRIKNTEVSYTENIWEEKSTMLTNLTADELMDCIAELPDAYRIVFNLFAVEGYKHQEIAAMLHIRENTSRSQFFRARQLLQESVTNLMNGKDAI